jgi:hypothetical protein
MAPKCNAKRKHTGEPCQAPRMKGKTRCKYHGGPIEKTPALEKITHGKTSPYIHQDEVTKIAARTEELSTVAGRAKVAAARAAIVEAKIDRIPAQYLELGIKSEETLQKGIKLLKELDTQEVSPIAPVIVLPDYDSSNNVFTARGVSGPVTVHLIEGAPFLKEGRAWVEAKREVDEETGLEFFTRLEGE